MNETIHTSSAAQMPWPTDDDRTKGASPLPGSEKVAPAMVGLVNDAVQGAHSTIDRLADRAAPAARQLGERVAAAGDAIDATTVQLRGTRDAWMEAARTTVRGRPLISIAAAFALGAVIARVTR